MLGSEIRFPLQSNRENQNGSPFLVEMCEENGLSSPATSMRPFQGPGVLATIRGKSLAPRREYGSRFPFRNNREHHPGAPRCFLLYVG